LPDTLKAAGIGYEHLPGLGGLRHARADSVNTSWQNASFRGFADYMQTPEFAESLEALIALAKKKRIAVMCAEAVPWRCHRSLIADALTVRGIKVEHIMSSVRLQDHSLTPFAQVEGLRITYPPEAALLRFVPLHIATPVTAALAVIGVQIVAADWFFHEHITPAQWLGILLVALEPNK
jgi:hypothetical protein